MDQSSELLSNLPERSPVVDQSADRRLMLRGLGGALAGLAAGMALTPNSAMAEARPTLTSLDQRVAALEAAMTGVVNDTLPSIDSLADRVAALESAAGETSDMIMDLQYALTDVMDRLDALETVNVWSGRCAAGTSIPAGPQEWVRYPLSVAEYVTSGHLTLNAGTNQLAVAVAGYYRIAFFSSQHSLSETHRSVALRVNGQVTSSSTVYGTNFITNSLNQIVYLTSGSVVHVEGSITAGGTAFNVLGANSSRLEATYLGQ